MDAATEQFAFNNEVADPRADPTEARASFDNPYSQALFSALHCV